MHYIKDIFEGKNTQHAHNKFIRYSKGEFVGTLINIKITKTNIKLNGSFHIINEILYLMAEHLKNNKIDIKGTLSWNEDLSPQLEKIGIKYLKVIKSRGIFTYTLQNQVQFKDLIDNLGDYNLLINFKTEDVKLATKNKLPKPNKEITKDFVKAIFPLSMKDRILEEFAFDVKDKNFKEIDIKHLIYINAIHMPKVKSFEEARKFATREGEMIRETLVDKKEKVVSKTKFNI
ncbi:MAG: hypothetical protein ACOC16_00350 [Nanoarchaeota archaeon]